MSTRRVQHRVTWSVETSEAEDLEESEKTPGPTPPGGVSAHLSELHRDILSAAKVVKQVQTEVAQLKLENETLRKELWRAGGEHVQRSSTGPHGLFEGMAPKGPAAPAWQPPSPAAGEPQAPSAELLREQVLRASAGPHGPFEGMAAKGPAAPAWQPPSPAAGRPQTPTTEPATMVPFNADLLRESSTPIVTKKDDDAYAGFKNKGLLKRALKRRDQISHLGWLAGGSFDTQTGGEFTENRHGGRHSRSASVIEKDLKLRGMLFDPQTIKKKMRQNIMRNEFDVTKLYSKRGCAQAVARSPYFEHVKLVAILLNTLWIAVDTEHNRADVLIEANIGFQIPEHCFCLYFVVELLIRLLAFQRKQDCLQSGWFIFDALLVVAMVFEDWVMTIVFLASADNGEVGMNMGALKNAAIVRILRVLRLARLGRAVRLMRQSPEVMIMVKALAASLRCVMWTCVLLACLQFFFGVCFTQMCKDSALEAEYFPSLTGSLHTLMIASLFPDLEDLSKSMNKAHFFYWAVFVLYLLITTITILNLLIGVLVEVAQSSARIERDAMDVAYVKEVFITTLNLQDCDDFRSIFVSKEEFADLLQDQDILKALTKVGVDVFGTIDLMDFIFMRGAMGFVELMEVVLQLRSSGYATVRDLVEVRKFLTFEVSKIRTDMAELTIGVRDTHAKTSEMLQWTRERSGTEIVPFQ